MFIISSLKPDAFPLLIPVRKIKNREGHKVVPAVMADIFFLLLPSILQRHDAPEHLCK